MKFLRVLLWIVALSFAAWACGALFFDFPWAGQRTLAALVFATGLVSASSFLRTGRLQLMLFFASSAVVLAWWLTLAPSNERSWQADVAQLASVAIDGDRVTLSNVRHCRYRTENDYTPQWETRSVRFSQITGLDLAINYWGSPYMAHPIACFRFADAPPLCFSIETRKEIGETYSALGGLYRRYEIIYVVADERDVLRVRTNYRQGEDVYLYHTTATPEQSRQRFREYLGGVDFLQKNPRWYNALTTNCTSAIRLQRDPAARLSWDWRMLVNGFGDEMLYERHVVETKGLSFAELKRRSLINRRAQTDTSPAGEPDFSTRIRQPEN
jgi:hypothetical protein